MTKQATKKCPYCGEVILAEAIKCRFCKEFLVEKDGTPVSYHDRRIQPATNNTATRGLSVPPNGAQSEVEPQEVSSYRPMWRAPEERLRQAEKVLFAGSPSLWGLADVFAVSALLIAVGGFLLFYPVGDAIGKLTANTDAKVLGLLDKITGIAGVVLILSAAARSIYRAVALKRIRYEVTSDRIEFARGIFSRKIDNIDLFRVIDIKLHRSLLDCLTGVGTVTLETKDETDPTFEFEKIAASKALYDVIKKASLTADRRQGVIHVD